MINTLKNFRNPCKKCLVNACCNFECDKLKDYRKINKRVCVILGFGSSLISLTICSYLISLTSNIIIISSIIAWLVIGTFIYIVHIIDGDSNEKWYQSIYIIFIPYLLVSIILSYLLSEYTIKTRRKK